jgi:hypothetical protein
MYVCTLKLLNMKKCINCLNASRDRKLIADFERDHQRMQLEIEVKSIGSHSSLKELEDFMDRIIEIENKERLVGM